MGWGPSWSFERELEEKIAGERAEEEQKHKEAEKLSKEKKDKSSINSAKLNFKKLMRIGGEIEKIVDHHKPFFAEEVYEKTLTFAEESGVLIGLHLLPEKEFHDKEALELDKFDSIIDEIEQVIRKRIRNIGEAKLVG